MFHSNRRHIAGNNWNRNPTLSKDLTPIEMEVKIELPMQHKRSKCYHTGKNLKIQRGKHILPVIGVPEDPAFCARSEDDIFRPASLDGELHAKI